MEKKKLKNKQALFFSAVLPIIILLFCACEQVKKDYDAEVTKAYEIRMDGDADSAKVLLDAILAKDSTVAMAWYELARTEDHMSNGDMQNLMKHHELAIQSIEKALEFDPDNTTYLYFKGRLQSLSLYAALQMGEIWWRYKLIKQGGAGTTPFEGIWLVAPEAESFGVGPEQGDISWWAIDEAGVLERDCFFDDTFIFGADGSFRNDLGTETWIEDWQGGSNVCGAPVAPHDGAVSSTYTYNEEAGTITLNGTGAYLGIPKANNGGELTNSTHAPASITYIIEFSENNTVMTVDINAGGGKIQDYLLAIEDTYLQLLKLDPEFHVAKLSLVEIYTFLPPEMGGDKEKAETYAAELDSKDLVCSAKAKEILMPQDADYVSYWNGLLETNDMNADLFEALGRVYLYENNTAEAWNNFEKSMELDENRNYLFLEIGRYFMLQAMQGQMPMDSAVPLIVNEFEKYLVSQPEPCKPMKAWTIGQMAMLKFRTGDEETGKLLLEEAKTLDTYYSKAFGTPNPILFIPPDSESQTFSYLSRPL